MIKTTRHDRFPARMRQSLPIHRPRKSACKTVESKSCEPFRRLPPRRTFCQKDGAESKGCTCSSTFMANAMSVFDFLHARVFHVRLPCIDQRTASLSPSPCIRPSRMEHPRGRSSLPEGEFPMRCVVSGFTSCDRRGLPIALFVFPDTHGDQRPEQYCRVRFSMKELFP